MRPIFINACSNVVLYQLHIQTRDIGYPFYPLTIINTLGYSYFTYVTCRGIYLQYDDDESFTNKDDHIISIIHYKTGYESSDKCMPVAPVNFSAQQSAYKVILRISNTIIQWPNSCNNSQIFMHSIAITGIIAVYIVNCQFSNSDNQLKNVGIPLYLSPVGIILNFRCLNFATIHFVDCKFFNNTAGFQQTLISFRTDLELGMVDLAMINCHFIANTNNLALISMQNYGQSNYNVKAKFINCKFLNNTMNNYLIVTDNIEVILSDCMIGYNSLKKLLTVRREGHALGILVLRNVNLFYNTLIRILIDISNTELVFKGQVIFYNNNVSGGSIISNSEVIEKLRFVVVFQRGKIFFSCNIAKSIIEFTDPSDEFIIINQTTYLTFSENYVCSIFGIMILSYPMCIFQYYSGGNIGGDYSVIFNKNYYYSNQCYRNIPLVDCRWLPDLLFANRTPIEVNRQFVKYINNSGTYDMAPQSTDQRTLCFCNDREHPDCSINQLGYFFPGQALDLYISKHTELLKTSEITLISHSSYINPLYISSCIVTDIESLPFVVTNCTRVNYTVIFPTDNWCALFIKINTDSDEHLNIFYVKQLPCPAGFILSSKNRKCVCYPKLAKFTVKSCNIDDQTILRPANSWISATPHNNSYTYHISLQCPFQYCLLHPSHLNLSSSNTQCQFNRFGVLCGQCQQGLSTIFASSQCQHCSNVFLLLILPIALAGLLLVLLLFFLNLTVTDGIINAFILYANIAGINSSVFFHKFSPAYIFTSLVNLDLGIPLCFYNGMDDYAKMWLQLAFPFYLIFIATSLIITSRYSTTIQRLTARRALPVLATLFLLSYTKILHAVSSVMFSYSIITQLPSEQSTLVWSVDANVSLLGVRFITLFILCLIIFLLQVPFSIILLFSRPLQRFHCINKFKPLLDAYQGPYKDKFYYWTGLHLVIRVVFLGISALELKINLMIGNIIVAAICVMTGILHPFKYTFHNYQELLLLFNLQILYIFVQHTYSMIAVNTVIVMAAVHFTLIVVYHVITYMCGGVIINKMQQGVKTVVGWMVTKSPTYQRFELANVPEVSFNYREYQEPLVAQDH